MSRWIAFGVYLEFCAVVGAIVNCLLTVAVYACLQTYWWVGYFLFAAFTGMLLGVVTGMARFLYQRNRRRIASRVCLVGGALILLLLIYSCRDGFPDREFFGALISPCIGALLLTLWGLAGVSKRAG